MIYIIFGLLLFGLELVYFRLADYFNIIDHPNERSSHTVVTLRGGGVIFPLALLLYSLNSNFEYPYFICALMLISIISFVDDIRNISNKVRLIVQLIAVGIMFYHFQLWDQYTWILICSFLVVIGAINAYNFMDGINGITGLYSLSIICPFLYLNQSLKFIDNSFLLITTLSIMVFLFFNFRIKARCFAGDVGSVSMAFIVLFILISLVISTQEFLYLLFLIVYGMDSGLTMITRLIQKENIFEPHRKHAYQLLSNELKFPQLAVSGIYAGLQLLINTSIIYFIFLDASNSAKLIFAIVVIVFLLALYLSSKGYSQHKIVR